MPAVIDAAAIAFRVMLMFAPGVLVSGRFPVDPKHWAPSSSGRGQKVRET
jgi:hypothetical protein